MSERLERLFPGLSGTAYRVTSPASDVYNCIAWATGHIATWWWPVGEIKRIFWPAGVVREETLPAFRAAFATLGYLASENERWEAGFEKIALFADARAVPTHAARQLPTGLWTSKLGLAEDIEHELRALEGEIYGTVVLVMKRPSEPATP